MSFTLYSHQFVDQPCRREHERDVGEHVYHRRPVHVGVRHVVELGDDVGDDGILDPLHGVGHGVQHEDGEDEPSLGVHPGLCGIVSRHY